MQVADYLRQVPLFSELSPDEMLDVLRIAKVVQFKAGDFLCRAGEVAKCMWVVDGGTVSVQVEREGRTSLEVKVLGRGEVIGELALVDSQPRSADVVATSAVQAYEIDRVAFDKMRGALHPAAFKMLRRIALTVATRLRDLNDRATRTLEIQTREPEAETAGRRSFAQRVLSSLRGATS